jgi:voltage-dependent calcium channel
MNPFSRQPSSEFERISLEDLSSRDNSQSATPQIQVEPPGNGEPPAQQLTLSPSRPILLSRVSLRRQNTTGTTSTSHWRKPSYSRVESVANLPAEPIGTPRPYDDEGGMDPDLGDVQEGLNVALGTSTDLGSWLPTTRQPSTRRPDQPSLQPPLQPQLAPQIVVQDASADPIFIPDERDTAGLTDNASQIAGAPQISRPKTRPQRPKIDTSGMLGADLGAVERQGPVPGVHGSPTSPIAVDADRGLSPGGSNPVIRHLRKASQRVVNIANTGDHPAEGTEFPFPAGGPGASPKLRPSMGDEAQESYFPTFGVGPVSPIDKLHTEFSSIETGQAPYAETIELRGKSLGIFGPKNVLRNWLCDLLLHSATEPTILVVIIAQTIFLIIQAAPNVETYPETLNWGASWVDYCLLAVFVFYSLEVIVRIIVSGFIFNPPTALEQYHHDIGPRPSAATIQHDTRSRSKSPSRMDTLKRQYSTYRPPRRSVSQPRSAAPADLRRQYSTIRTASPGPVQERGRSAQVQWPHLAPTESREALAGPISPNDYPVPIFSAATFHRHDGEDETQVLRSRAKARLARRAYLRHSFNRVDFIAVVSYWIALVLELTGLMSLHHIYIFRMLACLRIFRLLGLTEGMSVLPTCLFVLTVIRRF